MRWPALFAFIVLGGCDVVFGLDAPPDAPPVIDAAPEIDAPPDAPACALVDTTPVPAIADTYLLVETNQNPSIRNGAYDNVNLGQAGTSRGLLRFTLSTQMQALLAADDGRLRGGVLQINLRASCPGGCTNQPTAFRVFALTDDWDEGTAVIYTGAAWYPRKQNGTGDPNRKDWMAPGADGAMDRSVVPLGGADVTAPVPGPLAVSLVFGPTEIAELRTWLAAPNLSLILIPQTGGTLFLHSRESMAAAFQLAFSYCPSP